jgi:hypothetical protein
LTKSNAGEGLLTAVQAPVCGSKISPSFRGIGLFEVSEYSAPTTYMRPSDKTPEAKNCRIEFIGCVVANEPLA